MKRKGEVNYVSHRFRVFVSLFHIFDASYYLILMKKIVRVFGIEFFIPANTMFHVFNVSLNVSSLRFSSSCPHRELLPNLNV